VAEAGKVTWLIPPELLISAVLVVQFGEAKSGLCSSK
jgi:hypothetical protein